MQLLMESVVCPKCDKKIRPPFKACHKEHIVCPFCKQHQNAALGPAEGVGNCTGKVFDISVINIMFNNMMDLCQFGCGYRASLLDLEQHEMTCLKMDQMKYCAIDNCRWKGVLSDLIKHVGDDHSDQLLDLSDPEINFIFGFNNPIILVIQFNKNNMFNEIYWLRLYEDSGNRFIIMVYQGHTGPEGKKDKKLKEYFIASLSNVNHLIKSDIIINACQNEYVTDDNFIKKKGTNIDPLDGDTYMINVQCSSTELLPEYILLLLECVVCMEIMHAPIKNCESGHSFCEGCAKKMLKCPTCRKNISQSRNYALERLSENIESNCKNKDAGCVVTCSQSDLDFHNLKCQFTNTTCVIWDCHWTGSYHEVYSHWENKHLEEIQSNELSCKTQRFTNLYHFADNNFLFTAKSDDNYYYISVHHLTMDDESDFYFDINISHPVTGRHVGFLNSQCIVTVAENIKKPEYLIRSGLDCKIPKTWFNNTIRDESNEFIKSIIIYRKLA